MIANDGNVYYKEDIFETSNWENLEELSKLNKESHIIKVTDTYTRILILCDDGYVYELDK